MTDQKAASLSVSKDAPKKPGGPNDVPATISREAWEAAMLIDAEIEYLLRDYGMKRQEGHAGVVVVLARLVQLAINQSVRIQ